MLFIALRFFFFFLVWIIVFFWVILTIGYTRFVIRIQEIAISAGALNVFVDHFAEVFTATIRGLAQLWND